MKSKTKSATTSAPPKKKILIVDDDAAVREMLARVLAGEGYAVLTAANGFEALDIAAATPLDLVLLDLNMPRMNGFQVLSAVRQRLGFTQLPVIVLTHSENPADVKRAYELGATSFFRKPDSLAGLDEMIHVLHAYWLKFNHFPE